MSGGSAMWDDLRDRMLTGAVMVVIGLFAIWMGGFIFHALVALLVGVMVWELVRMVDPNSGAAILLGAGCGLALFVAGYLPLGFALPLCLAPALAGFGQLDQNRTEYMTFTTAMMLAGFGMTRLHDDFGHQWMFWLVGVVVATDILGYFAGRFIGGPKFWPKVSPKKTWSGTAAGWIGAVFVGLFAVVAWGADWQILGISVAVSMASQMGDIAESALKRKMDVKDSSDLLPGHGGLMDRFDGMLGASLMILLVGALIATPQGF